MLQEPLSDATKVELQCKEEKKDFWYYEPYPNPIPNPNPSPNPNPNPNPNQA